MRTKYLLVFMGFIFFLSCSKPLSPQPYLLNQNRNASCQQELEESIGKLINAKHLKLSTDAFSKQSFVYLSNQKSDILGHSTIINDLNGRKRILLYKKNKHLYVGTSGEKDNILKSQALKNCVPAI